MSYHWLLFYLGFICFKQELFTTDVLWVSLDLGPKNVPWMLTFFVFFVCKMGTVRSEHVACYCQTRHIPRERIPIPHIKKKKKKIDHVLSSKKRKTENCFFSPQCGLMHTT